MEQNKIQGIKEKLDVVSDYLDWCGNNLKAAEYTDFFTVLVEQRRKLRRIYRAAIQNPAIAAYGESQKGKSYIITSLLSSPGEPLSVKDENGNMLVFIDSFNRKTTDQESTGVITRFTTDVVSTDAKHPIRLQTLSVADIITMLAEYFMQAVEGYTAYQRVDLESKGQQLMLRYKEKPIVQHVLTEDEVFDIQDFLYANHKTVSEPFKASNWFRNMAFVVTRIPLENMAEEFSPLWFENAVFTNLLKMVLRMYQTISFESVLYIDTQPVLSMLKNPNADSETLMSVEVLLNNEYGIRRFYDSNGQIACEVNVVLPDGRQVKVDKAFLSLITAEAAYHVEEDNLKVPVPFVTEGIRESDGKSVEDILRELKDNGIGDDVQRDFLYKTKESPVCFDLLDFPGSRVVGTNKVGNILNDLANIMLREKVSYLFNKYSAEQRLSVLMLCNDEANTDKTIIEPLAAWVNTYVGKTPSEREENLSRTDGISPLFLISTKYNRSLVCGEPLDIKVFTRRFNTMLNEVIKVATNSWFMNWTKSSAFDNTYLLRDFEYSTMKPGCSGLFEGYVKGEKGSAEHTEFNAEARKKLKEVFLHDENVRLFFPNPEVAWDVASTIGNDGSYLLFQRLGKISRNIESARTISFESKAKDFFLIATSKMSTKHHNEEVSAQLESSIREAKRLDGAMRVMLNRHEDFFGRFIQYLQFTPYYASEVFMSLINSTSLITEASIQPYEILLERVKERGFSFKKDDQKHNNDVLLSVFGTCSPTDSIFKDVNLQELFDASFLENRSASHIMARELINGWLKYISSPESTTYFTNIGFAPDVLSEFLTRFRGMVNYVNLYDRMADAISVYVDYTMSIRVEVVSLIADVAANLFNSFVMDMGYSYLSEEKKQEVSRQCEEHNLQLTNNYGIIELEDTTDEDVLQRLFDSLQELGNGNGGQLLKLPSYKNMVQWIELTTIAYLVNFAVEDWGFTPEENAKLGNLINRISLE